MNRRTFLARVAALPLAVSACAALAVSRQPLTIRHHLTVRWPQHVLGVPLSNSLPEYEYRRTTTANMRQNAR